MKKFAIIDVNTPVRVQVLEGHKKPFDDFFVCRALETVFPVVRENDIITVHRLRLHPQKEAIRV